MRAILLSLALVAAPSAAQAPAQPAKPPVDTGEIVRVLNDPATAATLTRSVQALSKALLDVRIGEVQAAIEGRSATSADRRRTIRDMGRAEDPNFERNLQRQLAESRGAMEAGMKALASALPGMMKSMEEARGAMERAIANMPSPTYPKR